MSRHKWELLPGRGSAWRCITPGCQLHRQVRPHERYEHQGFTEYYVLESGAKRFLEKLAPCPYLKPETTP